MKSGKAVGPDDIPVEVWKCLGEAAVEFLTSFFNRVLESERMPEEWRRSVLVPIFKNKGDVQSCSNYRGIKLMSHIMKLWERVVEARLRKIVEICEQQYGFMPRKSTTDAIFALRILMEKYRDGQRELHCVFVDLEKAYDRVAREDLWYCMRKSGVAEKYVRVVQDMYERSRTVVRCAVSQTEELKVEVGLHQGSALSPFLFAIVMDQLSEEVRQESPWTMMFADDIVICSESREQVEENLERWRFALERRGMKVSRSKTEYMCVNEREGSGTVRLQGEEVKNVQEFKYLGSTVQSNGESGKEVGGTGATALWPDEAVLQLWGLRTPESSVSREAFVGSALIDSGVAINLIDGALVEELGIPTFPCVPSLRITAIDSQPIGEGYLKQQTELLEFQVGLFHHEQLPFYVTSSPANAVILGFPWLRRHDPQISWRSGEMVRWSPTCLKECLRDPVSRPCRTSCMERASPAARGHLPHSYMDFKEVFSEEGAACLPSHQVWDCATHLLPNTSLPKGWIYPLSFLESKAMEEYIETALAAGHIRPSMSPAAAGFFFDGKKDGGLRPCIDYRGLNAITVWYPYSLPLVPAALEQLRGVKDLLGKGVIAYIDDILVYSTSMEEHVRSVREVLTRLQRHHLSGDGRGQGPGSYRVACSYHGARATAFSGLRKLLPEVYLQLQLSSRPSDVITRGKPKKLTWTDQAQIAFQQLKNCFTTAPILRHPDPYQPFMVEADASSSELGAVLSQHHGEPGKLHPCAYYSRKLMAAEVNYDMGNRELLAIKTALEEWRHWLEGARHPFQVLTNHRNLEYPLSC
ncbi:hypothetical protein QTP86_016881 [Hemibagrus guttatus]|nr:hypothetical protein QTP86_016881 [Hemibagrus guttatus]